MMNLFNSKTVDIVFAVLLSYFAWNRYADGHTGVGILLAVIALLNIVAFIAKLRIEKKGNQNK